MNNPKRKKIKIKSKGMVLTSRGMVRTPIEYPYLESYDAILLMITRYNAKVVEVLDDGREVELNINNFNIDNSKPAVTKGESVEVRKDAEPAVITPTAPINKNMSRKERKRLERERKLTEESVNESEEPSKNEEVPVMDNNSEEVEVSNEEVSIDTPEMDVEEKLVNSEEEK